MAKDCASSCGPAMQVFLCGLASHVMQFGVFKSASMSTGKLSGAMSCNHDARIGAT